MGKIFKFLFGLFLLSAFIVNNAVSENEVYKPIIEQKSSIYGHVYYDQDGILGKNYIGYRSAYNIQKTKLVSNCYYNSQFVGERKNVFIFELDLLENCSNPLVSLYFDGEEVPGSKLQLSVIDQYSLLNHYTDYSDYDLNIEISGAYLNRENVSKETSGDPFDTSRKLRKLKELDYKIAFLNNIKSKRSFKYIVPVLGESLPTRSTFLPNSGRPYRENYTDGIHHGWDIYGDFGTDVVALDDGIIIHIVSGFEFEDLSNIDHSKHDHDTYTNNLNVLRGNQVWLKTMKGDVVFYSHLSQIEPNLKVGDVVYKGENLGKIGISGVPDKDYKDIHLHFELQKNPRDKEKYGKYTLNDIMNWDWYFKGETFQTILDKQHEIFNY